MKILIPLFLLSSCAFISPNPNRDNILSDRPMKLVQFTTDYCSEWPNGTHEKPELWANCCFTHDLHYWIGGTEQERIDADKELKQCVKLKSNGLEAFLMYIGVRMGGKPGNASFAWGYGWTVKRDYIEMPASDLITAKNLLLESTYIQDEKTKTLVKKFITNVLDKKIPENR